MRRRMLFSAVVLALGLVASLPARAQPAASTGAVTANSSGNSVEFQADAQREVANDTLKATLYAELSDANSAQLANTLNRTLADALKSAAEFKTVRARSGGNQTYPVYDRQNKLTGWRGRAEIRIDSRDFAAAAALIGKLQSGMQLAGVSFAVSSELRRQTENELITEAIAAFRARADIVRQSLAGRSYKIRRITLNTGGFAPQPRPYMAARALASAEVAPPPLEGGQSTVTVSASGAIDVE
jgi:predicted secreted protein